MKPLFTSLLILNLVLNTLDGFTQGNTCKEDLLPRLGKNRLYGYSDLFGNWKVIPFYTSVEPFRGSVAVVKKGKKFGLINCGGKVVLRPVYQEILPFVNGFSWLKENDKWGLINEEGKFLLNPLYEEVVDVSRFSEFSWVKNGGVWGMYSKESQVFTFSPQFISFKQLTNETALVKDERGLSGVIDFSNKEFVLNPQFELATKIVANAVLVKKAEKYGLINDKGQYLLNVEYDSIIRIHKYRVKLSKNGKSVIADAKGNLLSTIEYDAVLPYSGGAFRVLSEGEFGYTNYRGREVISCAYRAASDFKRQRAIVQDQDSMAVITPKNDFVLHGYENIEWLSENSFLIKKNGFFGVSGLDGDIKLELAYDSIYVEDGYPIIRLEKDELFYFYDLRTFRLFGKGYNGATSFSNLAAIVTKGRKVGVVNDLGEEVIDCFYDAIKNGPTSFYVCSVDEETSVLNMSGNQIGVSYNEILPDTSWPLIVRNKSVYGGVDSKGVEVLPLKYHEVKKLDESYLALRKGKKFGVYSNAGKEVLPLEYTDVDNFSERFFNVKNGAKWGYVDLRKKVMIDFIFDAPGKFENGKAFVREGNESFYIDKKGKQLD